MVRPGVLLALAALWAPAQSRLEAPRVGFVLDWENRLRPLYGIAGNFVLGEAVAAGVISAASSTRATLIKLERELVLLDAHGAVRMRWEAPPGGALFAFTPAGEPALVYFSETGELCRIAAGQALAPLWTSRDWLIAVGKPDDGRAALIVRSERGLVLRTLHLASGQLEQESLLALDAGPAVLLPDGLAVYARGPELCVKGRDESERCVSLPTPAEALGQLNQDWVEIVLTAGAGRMALRVGTGSLALYGLPEVKP